MGLFGGSNHNTTTTSQTTTTAEPRRSGTLFSRRHSSQALPAETTTNTKSHNLLHRNTEDTSITAARERIINAEAAERNADRALMQARVAVKEAREHCKRLEREAAEE